MMAMLRMSIAFNYIRPERREKVARRRVVVVRVHETRGVRCVRRARRVWRSADLFQGGPMEQNDAKENEYPRGRGYGNDYMRGGEVFGGYGYQERDEYVRPRGSSGDADGALPIDGLPLGDGDAFPQDERAGGWDVPQDVAATLHPDGASGDGAAIEHTFGDTGGNRMHSKSYYVTQAQLQQRILKT